jgi:uracil-DNA glycosylase family 4
MIRRREAEGMAGKGTRGLSDRQRAVLDELGITLWLQRAQPALPAAAPLPMPAVTGPAGWEVLERRALACTACTLHQTRTQVVFGTGNRQASWMVIGEAPGADEDRQGEPFVGRAGQLLNEMLRAAGLDRHSVYIANILKCRPPDNRDPRPEEVAACSGFLQRQVELVAPRLILCVGRIAAQTLLDTTAPISTLRGRVHALPGIEAPVVVTYHPAYLLRSPGQKRRAWEDLCLARRTARTPAAA